MKPIILTVAGLHSFREKQTIDFGSLCEGGVFGIFGPTGSGKSSILDAMTLALYGKVERASNNTLGILNHAEEQLHVSFTFELENANGAKRYMIERSFKRTDEIRVKSAVCRLIEVEEESVVLADKSRDVDQHIQELLGLTIDDFTRAVVLPQGKFAEFLSLKGADRRQMLQRLFNLEQYGDKLNKKLKNKLGIAKTELGEVTAEQTGLGDASVEAIKAAEKELQDVELLLSKRQIELNKIEADYEKSKNIWEWQQQKISLSIKMNEIEQEKPRILQLEEKVKNAETADRIIPYLEEFESATKAFDSWTSKHKTLQDMLVTKKEENEKKAQHYHHARLEKTEKLPYFVTKKQQLIEAKSVQEKILQTEKDTSDLKQKIEALRTQVLQKQKLIEGISATISGQVEKQKQLKGKLVTLSVPAGKREELRKANDQKQAILHNQATLKELIADLNGKQKQVTNTEKALEVKNEELQKGKTRFEALFSKTALTYEAVCNQERESEKIIVQAEHMLDEKKQQLESLRRKNIALQLAGQLTAGEACPVCGSTHHPNPVSVSNDHGEILESEMETLTKEITRVREIRQELTTLKLKLEQISQGLVQEYPGQMVVPPKSQPLHKNEENSDIHAKVDLLYIEYKSLHQDYLELQETGRKAIQEIRGHIQHIGQLESSKELNQKAYNDVFERVNRLKEKIQNQTTEWNDTFKDIEFDFIESKLEEISRNDKLHQEIVEEIDSSAALMLQKEQERQNYQDEFNSLERKIVEYVSTLRSKDEVLLEMREKLSEEIGNNDIDHFLSETEYMLTKLEETESKAYEEWQQIQSECQQLENETHAATQSLQESKTRLEHATVKWNESIAGTLFTQGIEVKTAIILKNEQQALKRQIEDYWDRFKQIQSEVQKVSDLLKGEELTLEKWEEIQQIREELKGMLNEAVEAKGAAVKALQVLQEKHVRFKDLEKRRSALEKLVEQYNKLQSVFKGNSFVEYLAEEQLVQVSRDATERLGILTRQRYAIEVDSQGGFIMRDDANGGVRRPVTTLSGGETFLTSLALALSLSAQIQLRGEYPLQFFFLDEGFGTLDADLLDTVVSALEKLHSEQLAVGVISHVQELRARLPKRLIVEPAEHSGRGTFVRLETL